MRNLRIILITLAVVVAATGFSWFGYNLFQKFHRPAESPFNAIPGNTALIIQLNKAGNLLQELNRSNLLWKALSRFPGINVVRNEIQFVDSSSRKNEKINKIFDMRPYAIVERFGLKNPIYQATASYGHFGREDIDATWEKTDKADELRTAAKLKGALPQFAPV